MSGTAARATREGGRRTRGVILETARRLFLLRSLAAVSIAEIAAEAGVFPNQITYYFGSKEALFAEAACREILHAGSAVERASYAGESPEAYVRAVVDAALGAPGLLAFVDAIVLALRNPDVAPLVERTFERLYTVGSRAVAESLKRHGWGCDNDAPAEIRGFWATILGAALERAVRGDAYDQRATEAAVRAILGLTRAR